MDTSMVDRKNSKIYSEWRIVERGTSQIWCATRDSPGSAMFLIFINDIAEQTQSDIGLFADDCLLYRTITKTADSIILQEDLNQLCKWACMWQMLFYEKKAIFCKYQQGK